MEKTKLGISVSLLAAFAFLSGYFGLTAVAVVCGYILIREENVQVRKSAVYTIFFTVAFALLALALAVLSNFLNVIDVNSWMYDVTFFKVIRTIIRFFNNVLALLENVVYGLLALFSFLKLKVELPFLDKFAE